MKNQERPDIFTYHDHLSFLRDWLSFLKATKKDFSIRTLSQKSQIAVGYLPMVLTNKRELSEKAFFKILPHLFLDAQEKKFLSLLRLTGESLDPETRIDAVNQMSRLKRFQDKNTNEIRVYEYLTKWFYVAIRELVALKDFKMDYEWIQSRIRGRLSIAEIQEAVEFLKTQGFIKEDENGKWYQPQSNLECREGMFKLSLSQFHRQMFEIAADSIEKVPRTQRYIMGHTVAISSHDFEKIKSIIDESIQKFSEVNKDSSDKKDVYHIEIAAFPLTSHEG